MPELVNVAEGNADKVTEPAEQIPEQYRGKSVEELVRMHQNAEKKISEQGAELGSLRPIVDQHLSARTLEPAKQKDSAVDEEDFFTDPKAAVAKAVQEALAPYTQTIQENQQGQMVGKLDADHPGWKDTVQSEPFQAWVAKSKVRVRLWNEANANEYDSANELLSTWKELHASKEQKEALAAKAVKKDRDVRAATTEGRTPKIDGRKILYREDLQELKAQNPDRYKALETDIIEAYKQGRVRSRTGG